MKAIVYEEYGTADVLELKEIEKPTPNDDEVLIKVRAATITPFDWHLLTGTPFLARIMAGLFKPKNKVLGTDVAGRVKAIGAGVKRFQPGDEVFGGRSSGGYAEFATVPEAELYLKPAELSFEEAAAIPFSAFAALIGLCELGQLKSGQQVLINGASGGMGTLALPIAKLLGAQVTAVCSTGSLELVRSLGADQVVDYTQDDFTLNKVLYDLILDVAGKRSFAECKGSLVPQGIYITTAFSPALALQGQWISRTGSQKMIPLSPTGPNQKTREQFEELLTAGKLKPIVDKCFPLSEVPDAFRYYEKGHIQGRVAITVSGNRDGGDG
jgi:NADPH:quinone reductase-like Zn-dependent oxidoreductase